MGTVPDAKEPAGLVVFDLDGTLFDDMLAVSRVAARVFHEAFGTPLPKGALDYLRTTGIPFELQVAELYPEATPFEQQTASRKFHEAKVTDAYAQAKLFPEVPRLLKQLDRLGYRLVVSTGGEKEMAELLLEREGVGFLFEQVLGAAQGTKDEHLRVYRQRWPGSATALVGDSRQDLELARKVPEVVPFARATRLPGWEVTPEELRRWGAVWADYSLEQLPEALGRFLRPAGNRRA